MVSQPDEADLILMTNLPLDAEQAALRKHPLFPRYLGKTFALCDSWNTPYLLPGIYVNARRHQGWGRFRTGSYALHHPDFKNPYIETYQYKADRVPEPELLFSFLGRTCHPCRDRLFNLKFRRKDVLVEDTSHFDAFSHRIEGKDGDQRNYFETCLRSKFILCPRGVGASSIRLFEALRLGIAPIIISDAWKPCVGPDWKRAAIFVRERDIDRLEGIVSSYEPYWREMGAAARQIHEEFFAEQSYFNFLITNVQAIARRRFIPEWVQARSWSLQVCLLKARRRLAAVPPKQRLALLGSKLFAFTLAADWATSFASGAACA